MSIKILITLFTLSSFQTYAEETKEVAKEATKEVVKGPEKEAVKSPKAFKRPQECVYQTNALTHVAFDKFDDEVKKIQGNFEKCEESLKIKKEQENIAQECKKSFGEVKGKRAIVAELVSKSVNLKSKEEFEKAVASIKLAKEDAQKLEMKHRGSCPAKVAIKSEVKIVEEKKAEVKAVVEEKKAEVKAVVEEKKAEVKALIEDKKAK
ncbi:MAG: hypothetical protein KBD76_02170 [Bacteriovorax sp.]|nr:hypothetical protein [Bacteriovorax sp.]